MLRLFHLCNRIHKQVPRPLLIVLRNPARDLPDSDSQTSPRPLLIVLRNPTGDLPDSDNIFRLYQCIYILPVHTFVPVAIQYSSSIDISPGITVWNPSVFLFKTPLLYKGLKNTYVFITRTLSFPILSNLKIHPFSHFSICGFSSGSAAS